tara:strand:+ start:683 stop:1156 length:474 start_codon:yes stop_codon:yes gene_type:complete
MKEIKLETFIKAPIERVFDLTRSIDLHKQSTPGANEEVVRGRVEGLIELGETVTWRAKHFGVYQELTVEVTGFEKPLLFCDTMKQGVFKSMKHTHRFTRVGMGTVMQDEFEFVSPLGFFGQVADCLFLKHYMTNFLRMKNQKLKDVAEGAGWESLLF